MGNPSWDIIVLFAFTAVGFFYGISAGKTRIVSLLFSFYVAGFLFENFYYLDGIVKGGSLIEVFLSRVFLFFLAVLALNALFSRYIESHREEAEKNWWHVLLLSFLSTGLLFSYLFHLFPARDIFTFSPIVRGFFASDAAFFWWLTLPLVALFAARNK